MSYRPYSQIIAAAVRLDNDSFLRARNVEDSADLQIVKLDSSNAIVLDNGDGAGIVKIDNSVLQLFSSVSDPSPDTLTEGQIYWNTATKKIKVYDGTSFAEISGSGGGGDFDKETIILSATDVSNQYVDLTRVAKVGSIILLIDGAGVILEGLGYGYTVDYTGGVGGNTRIYFQNNLASGGSAELIENDVLQISYGY